MIDFTKKESIAILEKHDWKYHGLLDAGWGEKFYTFDKPDGTRITLKLGELRAKAYRVDMRYWLTGLSPR